MARRRHDDDGESRAGELLDQAFHELRRLPAAGWAWLLAGSLPFVSGLLFFWSEMARSGDAAFTAPGWALVMTALYLWMKVTHGLFARTVWAGLTDAGSLPPLGFGEVWQRAGALCALSAIGLPVQMMTGLLVLPLIWVFAFFHSATVLSFTTPTDGEPLRRIMAGAWRTTTVATGRNIVLFLLLVLFGFVVWLGVVVTAVLLPQLVKMLTGLETEFTRSPKAAMLNTLFVAFTVAVTWLIVGPLWRIASVLNCFYVQSAATGADLVGRLHVIRRRAAAVATALLLASGVGFAQEATDAAPPPTAEAPAAPAGDTGAGRMALSSDAEFEASLRRTLDQSEYRWRLPREQTPGAEVDLGIMGALRRLGTWVGESLAAFGRDVQKLIRKVFGGRSAPSISPPSTGTGLSMEALRGLAWLVAIVLVVALVVWGVLALLKWRRTPPAPAADGGGSAPVDLANEEVLASALPEDEWMRLAREKLDAGEPRLAVRAMFLAILALLGERRWVEIVRFKSNRDYRSELGIRARAHAQVQESFGESVGIFERVWYGLHEVQPERLQRIMDHYLFLKDGRPS